MAKRDYYDILGLQRNASAEEIKKAYRRLARKYHPDTAGGDARAAERFKELQEAYEVLNDMKKRQVYDRFGHAGVKMGTGPAGYQGRAARNGPFSWSGSQGGGGFDFDASDIFGGGGWVIFLSNCAVKPVAVVLDPPPPPDEDGISNIKFNWDSTKRLMEPRAMLSLR